jgi:uncharacterized membrane protein YkgB
LRRRETVIHNPGQLPDTGTFHTSIELLRVYADAPRKGLRESHEFNAETRRRKHCKEPSMSLGTILLIILILVLLGVVPSWPYSSGWGYGPSGLIGVVLVIVLILVLLGRI